MSTYYFVNQVIPNPLHPIFLCGTKYTRSDPRDKRNVLEKYISDNRLGKPIILERFFSLSGKGKSLLPYKDILIKGLYDIEQIMSYMADEIIIVHDSYSTSAELGFFSSNINIMKKTIVLLPQQYSVDEDKKKGFIQFAFNDRENSASFFWYTPVFEKVRYSNDRKGFHSYFLDNHIDEVLSYKIKSKINSDIDTELSFIFTLKTLKFNKSHILFERHEDTLSVSIPVKLTLHLVLAALTDQRLVDILESKTKIIECRNEIISKLEHYFINTYKEISKDLNILNKVEMNVSEIDFSLFNHSIGNIIGFALYALKALDYIELPYQDKRFGLTSEGKNSIIVYSQLLTPSKSFLKKGDVSFD